MEEARAVLERLERIDRLERAGTPASEMLQEVRALLAEAEAWVRAEPGGTGRAEEALEHCNDALSKPFLAAGLC